MQNTVNFSTLTQKPAAAQSLPPLSEGVRVSVRHITTYTYDRFVKLGVQTIRLCPSPHCSIPIYSYSMKITPEKCYINWIQDACGNPIAKVVIPEKTNRFQIEIGLIADLKRINPFGFYSEEDKAKVYPFEYDNDQKTDLAPYLKIDDNSPVLREWVKALSLDYHRIIDLLVGINKDVQQAIKYIIRLEPGVQTPEETLTKRTGSCRDIAWLLCQVLRHLGFATRFTSGYLLQLKSHAEAIDGPKGPEQDFIDLHAWTEVYVPGDGWVGLDPTSSLLAGEGHIPLCSTPLPARAAPVSGLIDRCESQIQHTMEIARVQEIAFTAKPYDETQWKKIDALGEKVDELLKKQGIELTMGGEPTFVSIDDRNDKQWHFTALGEEKRNKAEDLLYRLKQRFAPEGIWLLCQGKWYANEPLPRWSLNCYWRKDGLPLWSREELLFPKKHTLMHTVDTARQFMDNLAVELGIGKEYIYPAHEDPVHYSWEEHALPIEDVACDLKLKNPQERQRLAQLLEQGIGNAVGYVMPIYFAAWLNKWKSTKWKFRSKNLLLTPGDSPIGLRLPLHRLSYDTTKPIPGEFESNTGDIRALNDHLALRNFEKTVITAICTEVRNGILYLFLPPVTELDQFIHLIAVIERVAISMNCPVILEGYPPPEDQRIEKFKITPDPGVLEVNIHPAENWRELSHLTSILYEEARLARLSPEKYLIDGRRCGTGGGSHIIFGGKTLQTSPFFKQPDLLCSMLTYWQHHPALSYCFSSLFVGPDSQAARIDEARHDTLYDLEIAFQYLPRQPNLPYWILDRYFSNFLVDVCGNTHRAEFCIDKLYSSEHAAGRMGLVELRAFEMQPNPRMALTLYLFIRTLTAYLAAHPYNRPFIRWGTNLHDRYMLPHYLWEDLKTIVRDLNVAGFSFESEWLRPHYDFHFPVCGHVQVDQIVLELRLALEPWPILKEERSTASGGTSRGVDSAIEKIQVRLTGTMGDRYVLTCNGRPVPLKATGRQEEFVAGVRYKAHTLVSTSHPYIPEHTPLIFDIVDTHSHRSIGGCAYYVAHPGGFNSKKFPINAEEAEGRRIARFHSGHTPGPIIVAPENTHPDFANTLDLRFLNM